MSPIRSHDAFAVLPCAQIVARPVTVAWPDFSNGELCSPGEIMSPLASPSISREAGGGGGGGGGRSECSGGGGAAAAERVSLAGTELQKKKKKLKKKEREGKLVLKQRQ